MNDLGRIFLREPVETVPHHRTTCRCLEESIADGKVFAPMRLLEIDFVGIEEKRLETAIVGIDPPAANPTNQDVAEKVGKSGDTAGVETARLVKEQFVSGQDIGRAFQDDARWQATWRLINIKANANVISYKGREAEDFEVGERFPMPK
jgi:hypothetical protein